MVTAVNTLGLKHLDHKQSKTSIRCTPTYGERTCEGSQLIRAFDTQSIISQTLSRLMRPCRRFLLAALIMLLPVVNGCGIHMHRPEDAKLAQAASDAFKDAKLNEAITAEFAASAEMLTQEIAAIRRQSNARRDQWISAFIGGTTKEFSWQGLSNYTASRIQELVGTNPDNSAIDEMLAAPANIYLRFNDLRSAYLNYSAVRTSTDPQIPRIGAELKPEATVSEAAKTLYADYKRDLDKYTKAVEQGKPPASVNGLLGETISFRAAQKDLMDKVDTAAKGAQLELDTLKQARDAKIAEANVPGKTAEQISQALKDAAAKTDEVKAKLKTITSVSSQAGLPDIQKKITGLQSIRQDIADLLHASADALDEKKPTQCDKEKIKLLATVSAIRAGIDGATYPKVSDLLLESERLRIEIERLQGLVGLEQERKTLLDLKVGALTRELAALRRAQKRAAKAEPSAAIAEETGDKAQIAADALAYVAESWSVGRTPAEELDFLLAGIDHRAALENSSAAFAQWSNLIGVPLSQLLAYHQSGIKSEDLANLINAAGLGAIAGGVYK